MKSYIAFALAFAVAANTFAEQVLYCAGTVRYPSGEPAAGVHVAYHLGHRILVGNYAEARTDASGKYEIIGQEDVTNYTGHVLEINSIMTRDVERNLAAVKDFSWTTTNVDLVLHPAITLSGSIKDTEGAPIPKAEVYLTYSSDGWSPLLEAQPITANEMGQFSMPALPQGRNYAVDPVMANGYGSGYMRVEANETRTNRYEFPTFVLKRANRIIAGHVTDDAGKPLVGAEVTFGGKGQPMNSREKWGQGPLQGPFCYTKTDKEGKFSFENVCDAPVWVYAQYNDPLTKIHLDPTGGAGGSGIPAPVGDTNIVIRLLQWRPGK